jgi:hypothetical protein
MIIGIAEDRRDPAVRIGSRRGHPSYPFLSQPARELHLGGAAPRGEAAQNDDGAAEAAPSDSTSTRC